MLPAAFPMASTMLILHTSQGEEIRTYPDIDGSFTFYDVPSGAHQLRPFHPNLLFPELRLDVNKKQVLVRASLSHNRQVALQLPLVVRPAQEAQYYEKRKPFDIWSFVKSPYGIMIMFSVFAIVVFPRLKMDPEDYKEFQEQMRQQGGAEAPAQVAGGQRGQAARLRDR